MCCCSTSPRTAWIPGHRSGSSSSCATCIRKGKTIIAATHDLSIAGDIADRAIVLSEDHSLAADGPFSEIIGNDDLLLRVNLIHEHAHQHGGTAHVHRHGHYGHYHSNGGAMHDSHKHHSHGHGHDHDPVETETLRKLQMMIEHWIEHGDSHAGELYGMGRKGERGRGRGSVAGDTPCHRRQRSGEEASSAGEGDPRCEAGDEKKLKVRGLEGGKIRR